MSILLFAFSMLLKQGEGMATRRFGKKYNCGGMLFNAITCLFAIVFFVFSDTNGFHFPKLLWVYGILSCIMFATGFYTMFVAYAHGSYVLSNMVSSFSGVFAIVYGIVFLKEPAGFTTYTGIVLVFLSVFLMQYKKDVVEEKKGFSLIWLISIVLCAVSNGFISIIQKEQQLKFDGKCDNEFMMISLGGAFVALAVLALIKERGNKRVALKPAMGYGALAGMLNASVNLMNLMLLKVMNISVLTPLKTGVGFLLSFLVSVCLYKENFTKRQLISAFIGIVALVLFAL